MKKIVCCCCRWTFLKLVFAQQYGRAKNPICNSLKHNLFQTAGLLILWQAIQLHIEPSIHQEMLSKEKKETSLSITKCPAAL